MGIMILILLTWLWWGLINGVDASPCFVHCQHSLHLAKSILDLTSPSLTPPVSTPFIFTRIYVGPAVSNPFLSWTTYRVSRKPICRKKTLLYYWFTHFTINWGTPISVYWSPDFKPIQFFSQSINLWEQIEHSAGQGFEGVIEETPRLLEGIIPEKNKT